MVDSHYKSRVVLINLGISSFRRIFFEGLIFVINLITCKRSVQNENLNMTVLLTMFPFFKIIIFEKKNIQRLVELKKLSSC